MKKKLSIKQVKCEAYPPTSVKKLFPHSCKSHGLAYENHCGLMPAVYDAVLDSRHCVEGYTLIGWCYPPFQGSAPHAIVFEKLTFPDDDMYGYREPGRYWVHGDANAINFHSV